jgi:hypothetical protein
MCGISPEEGSHHTRDAGHPPKASSKAAQTCLVFDPVILAQIQEYQA